MRENNWNLSIRRYADNAPPSEPHDVTAHLVGGIPKVEVAAKTDLFGSHGLDSTDFLVPRNDHYFDFAAHLRTKADLKPAVETNSGLLAREIEIKNSFNTWWDSRQGSIIALAGVGDPAVLVTLRDEFLSSFSATIEGLAILDPFTVRGIIAQFWDQSQFDFRTLMVRGAIGVVDAWRSSVVTVLKDKKGKESLLDHKLVTFLMGDFVREIADLELRKAEIGALIGATTATPEEGEDEEGDVAPADEVQVRRWKKELSEVNKTLKAKWNDFTDEINKNVDGLSSDQAAELLLKILHGDMKKILNRCILAQRGQIVTIFENWWDKYRTTMTEIESERAETTKKLKGFLKRLKYV